MTLNNHCFNEAAAMEKLEKETLLGDIITSETVNIAELTARYCELLYQQHQTYQAVARITGLDRRTVKKYLDVAEMMAS